MNDWKSDEWNWAKGKVQTCGYCKLPLDECACEGQTVSREDVRWAADESEEPKA